MALTPARWLAIFAAAAVMIAAAYLQPGQRTRALPLRDSLMTAARRAEEAAAAAAADVRLLRIRDSLAAASASWPRTAASRVVVDPALSSQPPAVATFIERARAERSPTPRSPIDVAFVLDTASHVRGVPRMRSRVVDVDYALPRTAEERCLVIARVRQPIVGEIESFGADRLYRDLRHERALDRLIGPCGFFEAFGAPGIHIAAWLDSVSWSPAMSANLARPLPRFIAMLGANYEWHDYAVREMLSPPAMRCVAGDADSCEAALASPVGRSGRLNPRLWERTLISGNTISTRWWWWWPTGLGASEAGLLADMARAMGPDAFRRFWSATEPMPDAFRSVTDTTLGAWTRDWARRHYGTSVRVGSALTPFATLWTLAIIAACLTAAALAANRRVVR
jgi:hypothetical protein